MPHRLLPAQYLSLIHSSEAETSVVCRQDFLRQLTPAPQAVEHDFVLFKIDGVLDFGLVGILSKLTGILARQHIPVFALSTYDTDYLSLIPHLDVYKRQLQVEHRIFPLAAKLFLEDKLRVQGRRVWIEE